MSFFILFSLLFYVAQVFCKHVWPGIMFMRGAHRSQKRASDPLDLKLQMVVGHHGGAWIQTQAPGKSSKYS